MSEPTPRFTGIFIPVEILELPGLTLFEMLLLSWIDALFCPQHGGCYASNEYLAQKMKDAKENTVAKAITNLRSLGLIEDISFNGRKRVIRALIGKEVEKAQSKAGLDLNPTLGWTKIQGSVGLKSQSSDPFSLLHDSKVYIKEEREGNKSPQPPPPSSKKVKKEKPKPIQGIMYGKYVSLPEGRYEILCNELGKSTVDYYIEAIDTWVPNNREYTDYEATIRNWHLRDKKEGKTSKIVNLDTSLPTSDDNREWFKGTIRKVQKTNADESYRDTYEYVQFQNNISNSISEKIYFNNHKFKDLVKNELIKRNYKQISKEGNP
jgi:hypothetical protein